MPACTEDDVGTGPLASVSWATGYESRSPARYATSAAEDDSGSALQCQGAGPRTEGGLPASPSPRQLVSTQA